MCPIIIAVAIAFLSISWGAAAPAAAAPELTAAPVTDLSAAKKAKKTMKNKKPKVEYMRAVPVK